MKKIVCAVIVLLVILAGCKERIPLSEKQTVDNTNPAVQSEPNANGLSEKEVNLVTYIDFVRDSKGIDKRSTLLFGEKVDIDKDGYDEVVLAWGEANEEPLFTTISDAYVVRDKNGTLQILGENIASDGYGVYELKLIHLQNNLKMHILCGLTNGGPMVGFKIYQLQDDMVNCILNISSPSGSGYCALVDSDNDGQFDGYTEERASYDVLYYMLTNHYSLVKDKFILQSTDVDMPEYPQTIEEVITQYISLNVIDTGKCPQIESRLGELCGTPKEVAVRFDPDPWHTAIKNTLLEIGEQVKFDINEGENAGTAKISYRDVDGNKTYAYIFLLIKSEGKWVIDSIE